MDALYRDYILEHYKNPRNFGTLDPHDLEFHDHNPLCGDELGVHIVVEDDLAVQVFEHGCLALYAGRNRSETDRRASLRASTSDSSL